MIKKYLELQIDWSNRVFGSGPRTIGIIKHIEKELQEIQASPQDLSEWIDVVILALDGYWRAGGTPETIERDLWMKQNIIFRRQYPFPASQNEPSEHIES